MSTQGEPRRCTADFTAELAQEYASMILGHVGRVYPSKITHLLTGAQDVRSPVELYPVFHGCYDWHSCVHSFWLLARIARRFPAIEAGGEIQAIFGQRLTASNVRGEAEYAAHPRRGSFERPYGWAWIMNLQIELERLGRGDNAAWAAALQPLTALFKDRMEQYLARTVYPTRVGTHFNSAFSMLLGLRYARHTQDWRFAALIGETARRWFAGDRDCQAWEPGADDFLSPALVEARLMNEVMPADEFDRWFHDFLPDIEDRPAGGLLAPVAVMDRTDPKGVHLDGLNLSRAWCLFVLASRFRKNPSLHETLMAAARRHLSAGLPHVRGDYMGEHWLGTYALLALEAAEHAVDASHTDW
jgi:hypothetical protein